MNIWGGGFQGLDWAQAEFSRLELVNELCKLMALHLPFSCFQVAQFNKMMI